MEIVTRKEAGERDLDRYFTGKPCIHGHIAERKTKTKRCIQCNRDHVAAWQKNNPDKRAAQVQRNRKSINESTKRSKLKNPEKYKALRIAWLEKNRERAYASIKATKKKNPEKYKALSTTWIENNRDRARARRRVWAAKNKGSVAANQRVQGAKRRGAQGKFTKRDIDSILKAQRNRCAYYRICGTRLKGRSDYHVDHILAIARGGTNDPSNLQVLCPDCNMKKGVKDAIAFVQRHGMLL